MISQDFRTISVETTRFGWIEPDEDMIVELNGGLIGFDNLSRFVLIDNDSSSELRWLQSLDNGAVAFPVIDPWAYWPDYAPAISDADAASLELTAETEKVLFAIVTVPRGQPLAATANLLGPILLNPHTRRGKQVIALDDCYTTKHSLFTLSNAPQEGLAAVA